MEEQPEVSFAEQQTYTGKAEVPGEKKSRTGLIIGIIVGVVLLLLCCCCIIALILITQWESISQALGL
jgi:hypothetical protein